jgi:predicted MPP superfamily phosphohydrolase
LAWGGPLLGDLLGLSAGTLLLAAFAASVVGTGGFTIFRLLSQALFGELLLGASGVAVVALFRGSRFVGGLAALAALSLSAVYVDAYHREPTDLQVRTHELPAGVFPERPLRILHLSDIQVAEVTPYEERVVREGIAQKPDLVIFTGDFVQPLLSSNRQRTDDALRPLLRRLATAAPLGAFAVRGDVDSDWPEALRDTGIHVLSGEARQVTAPDGKSIVLVGLTIGMSRGREKAGLEQLVRGAPQGDFRIVFGHNPNFVAELAPLGKCADLVLAGHTHGGQVALPLLGAPFTQMSLPNRYASGLHDYEGLTLHVSAGVGMERAAAPQIRFLCPPEICLLRVR